MADTDDETQNDTGITDTGTDTASDAEEEQKYGPCSKCIYSKMGRMRKVDITALPLSPINMRTKSHIDVLESLMKKTIDVQLCGNPLNCGTDHETGEEICYPTSFFNRYLECRKFDDGSDE